MLRFSKRIGDCTQVNSLEEHYRIRNRFSLKRLAWAVTCVTCKIPSFCQNKRQIYSSLWKSWLDTRMPFLSPLFIYSFWFTYGLPSFFFLTSAVSQRELQGFCVVRLERVSWYVQSWRPISNAQNSTKSGAWRKTMSRLQLPHQMEKMQTSKMPSR